MLVPTARASSRAGHERQGGIRKLGTGFWVSGAEGDPGPPSKQRCTEPLPKPHPGVPPPCRRFELPSSRFETREPIEWGENLNQAQTEGPRAGLARARGSTSRVHTGQLRSSLLA
ncbi:hypothetical protein CTA1_7525 [Colletotrichum tanaceti]|uniref:Uncharacterized protein n=1 Tax=Colletotrichum tanaceti TaxID=1306861 RepID=A0A4U6X9P5_9PEZI|nr:hypothetical protein CTA1_7525 [Colletotrichum tanaceti]